MEQRETKLTIAEAKEHTITIAERAAELRRVIKLAEADGLKVRLDLIEIPTMATGLRQSLYVEVMVDPMVLSSQRLGALDPPAT